MAIAVYTSGHLLGIDPQPSCQETAVIISYLSRDIDGLALPYTPILFLPKAENIDWSGL